METKLTQHTPGPWARTNLTVHTLGTRERPTLAIARVLEASVETEAAFSVEQATANARLIAAAPALLKALEAFVSWSNAGGFNDMKVLSVHGNTMPELIVSARDAVAQVRGEA